jgi:hypothetical protein
MADAATVERAPAAGEDGDVRTPGLGRAGPVDWVAWARWLAVAALAIPFLAAIILALTSTWFPASDTALIELRTHDTGTRATPLVGPFSRLHWNHPGPLLFWVLAIPYRLLGSAGKSMLIGAVLLNAAAAAGTIWLAFRRGGTYLALATTVGIAVLIRATGAGFLVRTWNPDLPVLPTLFLVFVVWSIIEGEVRLLPVAVVVACFGWQSHLGYLPVTGYLVAVAFAATGVILWRRHSADPDGTRVVPPIAAGVVALGICVAPVVVQQLTGDPGNLSAILDSFRNPQDSVAGLTTGLRVGAMHLTPAGTWLTGTEPLEAFSGEVSGSAPAWLLVPLGAALAAAALAYRARAFSALRFLAVTVTVAVVGVLAVARTTGDAFPYLFNWFRPLALALWLAVGWAVVRAVHAQLAARRASDATSGPVTAGAADAPTVDAAGGAPRPVVPGVRIRAAVVAVPVLVAATAVLSVLSLSHGLALDLPDAWQSEAIGALRPATLAATTDDEHVHLRMEGACAREIGDGLGLQLVKNGTEVVVADAFGRDFGWHRTGASPARQVRVVCGQDARAAIEASTIPPVATYAVITADQNREREALRDEFARQLQAAGRDDLVPVVDSDLIVLAAIAGIPGVSLDQAKVTRYGDILQFQRRSVAVFVEPAA